MNADALIQQVIERNELQQDHTPATMDEVNAWQSNPGIGDPTLVDWSADAFITIDNPDSRDLDQALLIENVDDGYRCRYALADASFYVMPGSALFEDALTRGASYYLPDRSIPMLPVALSEDLVSLNPGVTRRALVFDMYLRESGECIRTDIVRARIQSQAKLSYAGVQRYLDGEPLSTDPSLSEALRFSLNALKTLGETLIQRSNERDVIQFDRQETQAFVVDNRIELRVRTRYETERYNEQISLLCNMEGAKLLQALDRVHPDIQPIFRVHDAPLKGRREALEKTLADLVYAKNLPKEFHWQPEQSLADYVANLPNEEQHSRLVQAIERQILIVNQASVFQAEPGRHHALGAASYARFSSPMREIVGIFTHKELLEALNQVPPQDAIKDAELRQQVIEAANHSKQQQKKLGKAIEFAAIDAYLEEDVSALKQGQAVPQHQGTIMGFRKGRVYVALDRFAVDIKVYTDDLDKQYQANFELDDVSAISNEQAFYLGDSVSVQVTGFDNQQNRFQLSMTSSV